MKIIDQSDNEVLKKLGVSSCMDLALNIPHSYNDLTIYDYPKFNQMNVVKIEIKGIQRQPKYLKISAHAWGKEVSIIIFNPMKYHLATFKVGSSHFVQAKCENNFGKVQLTQPRIVTAVGIIIPIYKTKIRQISVIKMMQKYLKVDTLVEEGLDPLSAKKLYAFHNPVVNVNYDDKYKEILPILKYVEIYNFLKKLSTKKQFFEASSTLNGDTKEFIASLPFKLTKDQQCAIDDIREDLFSPIATRRVIMGDVGSGKTVVILSSAMNAYPKRSILMVPTTILAAQIYEEAMKFLPQRVRVVLVTSKDKDIPLQEYDFIIGTHVLLYRDLPKCDLVMIDEQHRFGTAQRDLIHKMVAKGKIHPHFLQFSATPIPRTMSLINSSLVKYSFIKEMPFKKDITTTVISKEGFAAMRTHIEKEINENRQVAIIYPLVEESENFDYQSIDEGRGFWEKRYKNVYVTYGKDKQKEQILEEFRQEGSILLATTVMEVGISLPRLSTIVIVGAERLGLATLHQLRGRVSRTGLKGYCYLYTNNKFNERLREFSKTISGFDIAELDLKYRQSGDVLGGILQHGAQFSWFSLSDDKEILLRAKKSLEG